MNELPLNQVSFGNVYYRIVGVLKNAYTVAECQAGLSNPTNYEIVRKIIAIRDNTIHCECGRMFVADKTKIFEARYN